MNTNIFFNIAAATVMLFSYIYFTIQYDSKTYSGKCFRMLLIAIFGAALTDSIAVSMLEFAPKVSLGIIHGIYIVYLTFVVLCAYTTILYSRAITTGVVKKTGVDYINIILMILHVIACVITPVTGIYYNISSDRVFEKGPFYIVIYLFSAYFLMVTIVNIFRNLKGVDNRKFYSIVAFMLLTISGAICQFFFFKTTVIYFIYASSALILLFAFETPDYQKLVETTKKLKKSQELLEIARNREVELSRTVNQLTKTATWVIYYDENGELSEAKWSPEFIRMLGYEEGEYEEDLSQLWSNSLHPNEREEAMQSFLNGLSGKSYKIEARLRSKDGTYRWYMCSGEVKLGEDGHVDSYQGIIQDIEDEKYKSQLIEERLEAINDLEKSQAELRRALFRAEEANSAKTMFLSNMSHDIRTPMNAIVGFTNLALDHVDDVNEVSDCLNTIKSSGEHLLSLINDVLDMSRIESGKVKVEAIPCSISSLIKGISDMTYANAAEKAQKYSTNVGSIVHDYVMCDRLRVNQILINCVGNAVKYTQEGGTITVTVTERPDVKPGYGEYIFSVKDNGMGMSPEFLKRVFEPFERAKSTTYSKIQGTGLGMAITKNLVEIMGGTIRAESEEGAGSEFIIALPFEYLSENQMSEIKSGEEKSGGVSLEDKLKALEGKHFIVVDDNKLNRRIVKRILGEKGMIIDEFESGEAVIERVKNLAVGEIDMIFMDIQMPGMNGYETTDAIRSMNNEVLKSIPIIAMTANAFEEDKRMAKMHGMNGHVIKPFKLEELADVLYKILCVGE